MIIPQNYINSWVYDAPLCVCLCVAGKAGTNLTEKTTTYKICLANNRVKIRLKICRIYLNVNLFIILLLLPLLLHMYCYMYMYCMLLFISGHKHTKTKHYMIIIPLHVFSEDTL